MIDGVPMVNFGQGNLVNVASTLYLILYPVPDYIADQEYLYEDDVTQELFLERIRGEVYMAWQNEGVFDTAGWSLRPMGVEYDTISVLEPFTFPWTWTSPEYENLPSWANRVYQFGDVAAPETVDHPWWTHVEVKPRRAMGVRKNQWPVLAVRNNNPNSRLVVTHRLKAWYR